MRPRSKAILNALDQHLIPDLAALCAGYDSTAWEDVADACADGASKETRNIVFKPGEDPRGYLVVGFRPRELFGTFMRDAKTGDLQWKLFGKDAPRFIGDTGCIPVLVGPRDFRVLVVLKWARVQQPITKWPVKGICRLNIIGRLWQGEKYYRDDLAKLIDQYETPQVDQFIATVYPMRNHPPMAEFPQYAPKPRVARRLAKRAAKAARNLARRQNGDL